MYTIPGIILITVGIILLYGLYWLISDKNMESKEKIVVILGKTSAWISLAIFLMTPICLIVLGIYFLIR